MALLETAIVASDWLKVEADGYRSRAGATITAGSGKLKSGQVLAQVTATKKFVPHAATGTDGSQTAVAILVFAVDATSADAKAVIVDTDAVVSHNGITHGPTVNDATKRAAAIGQLAAVSIKVREGA